MATLHGSRARPACHICHKTFSNKNYLPIHTKTFHTSRERQIFPCTFPACGRTYLSERTLLRHVRSEHTENPVRFPCTLCEKELKSRTHLARHIATHTTEKCYKCPTCGRTVATKENLKKHEVCMQICGFLFSFT